MKRIDIIGLNGNDGLHYNVKKKRKDSRPLCECNAYPFPHKIGGKCKGADFLQYYLYNDRELCQQCNCFRDDVSPVQCDALNGAEEITEAECYIERLHSFPGEYLPINFY